MTLPRLLITGSLVFIAFSAIFLYLASERSRELSELTSLLKGAELLRDNKIYSQPPLTQYSSIRRWTFAIEGDEASQLEDLCRDQENALMYFNSLSPGGCVASYAFDQESYRYATLSLHDETATISSISMSASELSAMMRDELRRQ